MHIKNNHLLAGLLITFLAFIFLPSQVTFALPSSPYLYVNGLNKIGCAEWGTGVGISADAGGDTFRAGDRVVVNGVVFMDNFDPTRTTPYNNISWGIAYLNSEGGTVSPNPWPIPNDTPFTWFITMEYPVGSTFKVLKLDFDKCNGGSLLSITDVTSSASAATTDPGGDPDGDGISSSRDNCPHAYNPDQEDGWGSAMGDACDTDWYNRTGQGVAGFVQKDGMFHLHGNCAYLDDGAPRCPVIASFDASTFDPSNMPMEISTGDAGMWSVWLHHLHSNNGSDVYQVNVYSTNPPQPDTLVDDQLEIHVNGASWQWYHRGGDTNYHGN